MKGLRDDVEDSYHHGELDAIVLSIFGAVLVLTSVFLLG